MAYQYWSWFFTILFIFVQPAFGHKFSNVIISRSLIEHMVYPRETSKPKTTFLAIAITASVVLVAGLIGLYILYRRQRVQVVDAEGRPGDKPHWWMVDGANKQLKWFKNADGGTAPTGEPDGRGRIDRLKEALQRQGSLSLNKNPDSTIAAKHNKVISPVLPIQTDPNLLHKPQYPDVLERGYQAPVYPIQSPPRSAENHDHPSIPPRALAPPQGLTRSSSARTAERRTGAPRSPAGRRRSLLNRKDMLQQRNPFLPPDASFSSFSSLAVPSNDPYAEQPVSAPAHGPDHFQLNSSYAALPPQAGLVPPANDGPSSRTIPRKPVPTPLQLDEPPTPGTPKTGRKIKFGLPTNPRNRGGA
ncbi:hypothetical protein CVT24_005438 [Panaeolus cyanescens]|uniref:Uncharacterized protein n=1 Tax=Panaeolus cyanescens TaxID=181874 RepID=A0A409WTE3_9AGAR|nr:hypothetical protein CVT24_005438 [Panaeolus cyanescens]